MDQPKFESELSRAAYQNDIPRILACLELDSDFDRTGDFLRSVTDPVVTPETFEVFLNHGWDVNSRLTQQEEPILAVVAYAGRSDLVEVLIRRGTDVNATDQTGHTATMNACSEKSKAHEECLRLLIAAGADLDVGRVFSPLTYAVEEGSETMVNLLLESGADVNRWYRRGNALSTAVQYNRVRYVPNLLAAGADPNLPMPPEADLAFEDYGAVTALDLATKLKRSRILPLLRGEALATSVPPPIVLAWKAIEKTLTEADVNLDDVFLAGAESGKITAVESQFGINLPSDLTNSWKIHDGQPIDVGLFRLGNDSTAFLDGEASLFRLLAVEEWSDESSRLRDAAADVARVPADTETAFLGWNPRWVPIARNLVGDVLCCDLAGSADGQLGQILLISSETQQPSVIAQSWSHCLAEFELGIGSYD